MGRWLTLKDKKILIAKAAESPELSHNELANWETKTFRLPRPLARSTVSDILRKAPRIMSSTLEDSSRRKPVKVTSMRLEKRLWAWITLQESRNIVLSRELIAMKARELQGQLRDAWDLSFSDGWMTRFMKRQNLKFHERHGEGVSADATVVSEGRRWLQELPYNYAPEDIYNMDETGLCFKMAPARSICMKHMRGVKKQKTRITLALTANADGSDAQPIVYLGRAKKPHCFGKLTPSQHGFQYQANKKAWMTGVIFREWLLRLDREMRAAGRHILLLVDNASSHKKKNITLTNVKLEYLPPNTTAFLQPIDAGIIATFKARYRRKQLKWIYDKINSGEAVGKNAYDVDQLQAMKWCDEIWDEMQKTATIKNCFQHTGIVFRDVGDSAVAPKKNRVECDVGVHEVIAGASAMQV